MGRSPSARRLVSQEVALIKAMLKRKMKHELILTYFSRDDRTINPAAIAEIKSQELGASILPASDQELDAFFAEHKRRRSAKSTVDSPLGDVALLELLVPEGTKLRVHESDVVEFKQSVNWGATPEYARTMAAFANNRGGYLVFGVMPDRTIDGLKNDNFDRRDPAIVTQFLRDHFQPEIRWDARTFELAGLRLGLIYVWPGRRKPIICSKQSGSTLAPAAIYYRYVGETACIRFPELVGLLAEREKQTITEVKQRIARIADLGLENTAILELANRLGGGWWRLIRNR